MNRKAILVFLIIAVLALLLAVGASAAEATDADLAAEFPGMFIDATGQWKYELEGGEAIITGVVEEDPTGDLVIPGEVDGYPVTVIGVGAFDWGDDLTSITIPAGVTHISRYAFAYASDGLKSITIPEGVTDIDDYAFYWCTGLASVTLPDSLTQINGNPFPGCPITTLNVSPGNPAYTVINGVLFDKRDNTLVTFPREMQDEYEIPQGTAGIGEAAFEGCDNLTSITIPDSVTEIGDGAFSQCQGLTDLTIPGSVRGIGDFAFWECQNLTSVTILDGVTSIGDDVFQNCNNLTCVTIPASVTDIGWAFDGCYDLVLSVQKGSYAEEYAKENDIAYIITE